MDAKCSNLNLESGIKEFTVFLVAPGSSLNSVLNRFSLALPLLKVSPRGDIVPAQT